MFAILAVIAFGFAYLLQGTGDHTNTWFSPTALTILGLIALTIHIAWGSMWPRNRQ